MFKYSAMFGHTWDQAGNVCTNLNCLKVLKAVLKRLRVVDPTNSINIVKYEKLKELANSSDEP